MRTAWARRTLGATVAKLLSPLLLLLVVLAGSASGAGTARPPIVFTTEAFGTSAELAVREADGTVRRLTRNGFHDGLPSWSPDRRQIAFVRADRGSADIWAMRSDGSRARRLAGGARRGSDELYPAWSPDGKLIAFSSYREGAGNIYVMRADGTHLRQLTRNGNGDDSSMPRFSPDGRYVYFSSSRARGIHRVRLDDGQAARAVGDGAVTLGPDVSPDGALLTYGGPAGAGSGIWVMRSDGTHKRLLVRHPSRILAQPRFSPDGSSILYTSFEAGETVRGHRLHTARLNGSGRALIGAGTEGDW
jgi:Tol biopolymer transport system component